MDTRIREHVPVPCDDGPHQGQYRIDLAGSVYLTLPELIRYNRTGPLHIGLTNKVAGRRHKEAVIPVEIYHTAVGVGIVKETLDELLLQLPDATLITIMVTKERAAREQQAQANDLVRDEGHVRQTEVRRNESQEK